MDTMNASEIDISKYQDTSYPMGSVNNSSVTLIQNNNNNSNSNLINSYLNKNKNKEQMNINVDDQHVNDQLPEIIKQTKTSKSFLYSSICFSVISYVLFIISLSQPKWQLDSSYFHLKESIFTHGIDIIYMVIIILFTIVDFIALLVLLRSNHFYKKTYYSIFLCFGFLVLLKLILDVVYLIRNFNSHYRLGSSFWLFTSSITLDLLSLCSYLLLIREYENELKTISLNKKLEDFRKSGLGSMISDGSQTQIQLPYNLNKDLPEKKIVNYQNQGMSIPSVASKSFDYNTEKDNSYINYINIKNIQDSQNSISYNDIPLQTVFPSGNTSNDNKIQNNSYRQSMNSNPSSSMVNNIDNSSPQIQNKKINIFKKGSPNDNNDNQIKNITLSNEGECTQDNTKNIQIGIANCTSIGNERNKVNSKNKQPESGTDQNIKCTVRPKRDSSLIINSSFSNMNNLPVKSSSENKRVSNSSYSLNVLQEEDISKSQILETSKTQTQDSYFNQSSTLVNNSDTNNSLEPIYSNELESLPDIESFEDYPAINRINQANSIPTTHSSSTPSQPKSQPPLQQHSQLPKPPLSQRPQSYQQFNNVPYTASLGSKQSSTTIDDYVPLPSHNMNTPSSSQIARKSQRDSLLNQIFGTTNDNKTFVSLTALTDENGRRETYQSFDQLPLENHRGPENSSFTKVTNEVSNEIPNESFSQTLCHDSFSQSYYLSHSNPDADNSLLEGLSYTQDITNTNMNKSHSTHNTPTKVLPEKDFSGHSIAKSNHTSSIMDKSANINKYSVKSLQLKNVPLNNLDPNINERINSITVNKYVNEENNDPSKETNFDVLASTSVVSEKELYQEPSYYGNSSFFDDKIPFYDRVNEYNERMEEKGSIVSSLSISSSSTSSIQNSSSSPSINDHYKNHPEEEMTEHTRRNVSKNYHQDAHLSEEPVEDEYEMDYYEPRKYFEPESEIEPESELEPEESRRHSNAYSNQSSTFDPNQVSMDRDEPLVHHGIDKGSGHNYNNSQTYVELHNGNLYENEEEEEEREEEDVENVNKLQHYRNELERLHHSVSSSSEEEEEEEVEEEMEGSHMPNINYEREENDYENQKPPVTVVTIPPLSPFELPAIAIPFNQPDPREVGTFSPIVTTQPTLTTKPISYTLNNHLSIPYDRTYLNDFSYNNNNNNNNMFNEQIRYTKKSHSTTSLNGEDLYSPHYYPRNSQPYPSGHSSRHSHSSQQQHYPHNDIPYTNQLFQHRQKSNITRRSIHSNASNSNSSAHLKNKTYVDNSVVDNTGNISIHSNSNTNDINTNSNKTNLTNSQSFYYYVCKQKFKPQNENEIEMNVGDIIQIYRILDGGWCYGKNRTTNCVGIIPQAFLATMLTPKDKGTPDPYVIELMEKEIEKLKDRKKMIIYLERRLQDPNLSETDREMYQQHLDYAYLTLESPSSLSIHY